MDAMDEMIQYLDHSDVSASDLRAMAQLAFSDTFAHLYDHDPFVEFLSKTYGPGGSMERDLCDPTIQWKVAVFDGSPIGYAKVSLLTAPALSPKPDALELRQIYVLRAWHGRGVADCLMNWALDHARSCRATEIYLTVFDHNRRAKGFYSRYGFSEVGHCTFTLGDRVDNDRVWCKVL
jgi:GNAT superfamily N-acetyltransferase